MITSRFTDSDWLQVTVQSDKAINEIQSFQARVTKSELHNLTSCLDETLRRIEWIEANYHTDTEAQEIYNHADVVRMGAFVAISYRSIYRVHLIFRSSSIFLAMDDLEDLLASLKDLLGT